MTTQISALFTNIKSQLRLSGIEDSRFEAAVLLEHFLGMKPHEIATLGTKLAPPDAVEAIKRAVEKRIQGYPLQYIVGEWEFYGLPFLVGEGVLIPRQDTETLVEAALEKAQILQPEQGVLQVADLCSGSGCVAVALDKRLPAASVYAVEKSADALGYLSKNLLRNESGAKLIRGDVLGEELFPNFPLLDMIVCNPPYLTEDDMAGLQTEVSFEPALALDGGADGLYFYREITAIWKKKLRCGGWLLYEIGAGQEFDVAEILHKNGFEAIEHRKDLTGTVRVLCGQKTEPKA